MQSLGYLISRQYAYVAFLVFTIPVGLLAARLKSPKAKQHLLGISGFIAIFAVCGQDIVYSLFTVLLHAIFIKYGPGGDIPQLVFVSSFIFRFIFSGAYYLGLPRNENNLANGMQLILTLKVISLAYEIYEFRQMQKLKKSEQNGTVGSSSQDYSKGRRHRTMPLLEEPTVYDIFTYLYCIIGLITGPFFRYRTYYDMLHIPYATSRHVPVFAHIRRKLQQVILFIAMAFLIEKKFPLSYMLQDEFYNNTSFYYRLFYIIPIGIVTLLKFSLTWGLAECGFAAANLGVYPAHLKPKPGQGPSNFDDDIVWKENDTSVTSSDGWSFKCCENIDAWQAMFSSTYEECLLCWNCSVQWWLATYVYSSSFVPKKLKPARHFSVSIVCALWHGFKAGYYFSFLWLPLVVFAEQSSARLIGRKLSGFGKNIYTVCNWFLFKCIGMGTFMIAYHLSNYHDIMRYMKSIYFFIYTTSVIFILANLVVHQLHFSKTIQPKDIQGRKKLE